MLKGTRHSFYGSQMAHHVLKAIQRDEITDYILHYLYCIFIAMLTNHSQTNSRILLCATYPHSNQMQKIKLIYYLARASGDYHAILNFATCSLTDFPSLEQS